MPTFKLSQIILENKYCQLIMTIKIEKNSRNAQTPLGGWLLALRTD